VWAASGPAFEFSDTWQLVINTGTTIVTFLMVFLIQNTQNRDSAAIQAKLDELILVTAAENSFIGIEHLTEEEVNEFRKKCKTAAQRAERAAHSTVKKTRAKARKAADSVMNHLCFFCSAMPHNSSGTAFRNTPRKQQPQRVTLYGLSPMIEVEGLSAAGSGKLVIERTDKPGEHHEAMLSKTTLVKGRFYDLARAGIAASLEGHNTNDDETVRYAKRVIELLQGGRSLDPDQPLSDQARAGILGTLNWGIGQMLQKSAPNDAIDYLMNAARLGLPLATLCST